MLQIIQLETATIINFDVYWMNSIYTIHPINTKIINLDELYAVK